MTNHNPEPVPADTVPPTPVVLSDYEGPMTMYRYEFAEDADGLPLSVQQTEDHVWFGGFLEENK